MRLSDFTFTFSFHALEKEMATHSSFLAWRIPGIGEPGGLPSMGSAQSRTRLKRLSSSSSTQSASCEMLGWMKHKLESKLRNNLRYADDTTLMAESEEELKAS